MAAHAHETVRDGKLLATPQTGDPCRAAERREGDTALLQIDVLWGPCPTSGPKKAIPRNIQKGIRERGNKSRHVDFDSVPTSGPKLRSNGRSLEPVALVAETH